jgi:aspartyl-tRNA(Asn)/glutamyl-tRNA(Gln) amidotransferase subunit C
MGMSKLDEKQVEHVAKLAQLTLSKKELEKYKDQLSKVISYVEELSEVDTKGVDPTSQTTGLENVSKDDILEASRCLTKNETLSGTDKTKNGYFVVPGVLTEKGDL